MLTSLLKDKVIVHVLLIKYIQAISIDSVVNVKVTLAKVIAKALKDESKF